MKVPDIIDQILTNRGISSRSRPEFLSPPNPAGLDTKNIGVDQSEIKKAASLISKHATGKSPIIIYGDYDADGITATAILWETLHQSQINTMPFIPHRVRHGYGLSQTGIDDIIDKYHPSLIITVDNGITAAAAAQYAQQKGIDIIVTDHHQKPEPKHPANAVIHSTEVAGAGLAWLFASQLTKQLKLKANLKATLELAAIGTVTDQVPLLGASRSLVKFGLASLKNTSRVGLNTLLQTAQIEKKDLDTYHLGFHLGPRLNAMGRLEDATESLRLLCTKDPARAQDLAATLNQTNQTRQNLTDQATELALQIAKSQSKQPAIIVWHENLHEGVIGLVAGKLAQIFWRPSIVISPGQAVAKASARSIPGFNIVAAIRQAENLLESVGGHPMAAGFSIKNEHLETFANKFVKTADQLLTPEILKKPLDIDIALPLNQLTRELADAILKLAPFGVGNPKPLIATDDITITDFRSVGKDNKHLKLTISQNNQQLSAIAFGKGHLIEKLKPNASADIAYNLDLNTWNNRTSLQLKIKNIKLA